MSNTNSTRKNYPPKEWGNSKSRTHYACVHGEIFPLDPSKNLILYKGRWRQIETDDLKLSTWVDWPGGTQFFEIKEFDKPEEPTQQTDTQKANHWWDLELTGDQRGVLLNQWYGAANVPIDEKDILDIWRNWSGRIILKPKETQSTTTDNGGELTKTDISWSTPGEWRAVHMESQKITPLYIVKGETGTVCNLNKSDYNGKELEAEANANLIAASKGMYYQLDRLVDFINTYGIRDEAGNSLLEDINLGEAIEVLHKANKNYKP